VNLKELSHIIGLSQTTVSRALNGYPEVSEATRLRVADLAKTHNYRPNARAKGLATGRTHAIGHVIPFSHSHEIVNPIFGDFISGVGEVYAREGYDLMMSVVSTEDELATYRNLSARSSVDGVVIHAPQLDEPRIALMQKIGLPFVVHGRASNEKTPYAWLDVNNHSAFKRATEFMLDLGHRHIGLVNGLEKMDFAYRRREGYLAALKERGVKADPALMRSAEMTEVFGYQTAKDMLQRETPPTAFLAASMISAIGVRRAIEELGLRMGQDVSVITHDDDLGYLKNGQDVPIFTACRSSVRTAGIKLAQLLLRQIENPDAPPETELLEVELIAGRSTGPVKS
jgi:LacI family transcriptional regulator